MITDPKDQKDFFGIEAENPDDFKTKFNEKYVLKDKAADDPTVKAKVSGAVLGSEMTNLFRIGKEFGIEFNADEKKELTKNEDLVSAILKRSTGTYVNQIEQLKATAGHGNDEKVKALELEKEALAKKLMETDSAWKQTAAEKEAAEKQGLQMLNQFKIKTQKDEAWKGVKIKQNISEVERLGLDAKIEQALKFDLSDTGKIEAFDAAGNRIPSKVKAGDFVSPTEAIQSVVDSLNLSEINPHGGKSVPKPITPATGTQQAAPTGKVILLGGKPVTV